MTVLLASGLLVAAIAVLAALASGKGVNGDELTSLEVGRTPWPDRLWHDIHPPLYPTILRMWTDLLGDRPSSLHALGVLVGLAVAGSTVALARSCSIPWAWCLVSAPVVLFIPMMIHTVLLARNYVLCAVFVTLSVAMFLRICRGAVSIWTWSAYVAASTAALYTFYYSVFPLATQSLLVGLSILLPRAGGRLRLRSWILAQACIAALFAPMAYVMLTVQWPRQAGATQVVVIDHTSYAMVRTLLKCLVVNSPIDGLQHCFRGGLLVASVLIVIFGFLALFRKSSCGTGNCRPVSLVLPSLPLLTATLAVAAFFAAGIFFNYMYLVCLVPLTTVLAIYVIAGDLNWIVRFGLGAVLAFSLVAGVVDVFTKPQWELTAEAAEAIGARATRGDVIVCTSGKGILEYYGVEHAPIHVLKELFGTPVLPTSANAQRLSEITASAHHVVAFMYHPHRTVSEDRGVGLLEFWAEREGWCLRRREQFEGIEVWWYDRDVGRDQQVPAKGTPQ